MMEILWKWLLLPVIHWLAVSIAILVLIIFFEAKKLAKEGRDRAMHLPVNAKMAEVSLQVTRADGTAEEPQTYRTYRNPLKRWFWAFGKAVGVTR